MKIACIADLHIKDWKDNEITDIGISKKLYEIFTVFVNMCEHCIKNDIKRVIIAGDINDTKNVINSRAFSIFKRILERFSEIDFYIIPGNHDITAQSEIIPDGLVLESLGENVLITAVDVLKGPKNVFIFNKPTVIENIDFIPYRHSILHDIQSASGNDILVSHFSLTSCNLSNGELLDNGQINKKDLYKWKLCILGDIHIPQNIDHIYYTGSPIPLTRSEADEKKRFLVIDTETLEVESIETTGYRKYINIEIKEGLDEKELLDMIKQYEDEGHHLIFRKTSKSISDNVSDLIGDHVIVDLYEEDYTVRGITSGMNEEEQFNKYLEIMNIADDDKNEYLKVGLSLAGHRESIINNSEG